MTGNSTVHLELYVMLNTFPRMRHQETSPFRKKYSPVKMSKLCHETKVCEAQGRLFHYLSEDDSVKGDLGKITLPVSKFSQLQQELEGKLQLPTSNLFRWQEIVEKDQNPILVTHVTVPQQEEKDLLSHNRWENDYEEHDFYSHPASRNPQNNQRWVSQTSQLEKQTLVEIIELLAPQHEQGRVVDEILTPPRRQDSYPCSLFSSDDPCY
ncbi:hypothetical protein IV203_014011 [Nitzschia inconspicua]|uniref:Uncharacterized protein n=1 Tax=Nitzschia inconspicua TaxID=303405 RepID=A0A9K3M7X5_9STRA|nr:hypothetical protein IV203_014011 [Nitzschia inconspicua]